MQNFTFIKSGVRLQCTAGYSCANISWIGKSLVELKLILFLPVLKEKKLYLHRIEMMEKYNKNIHVWTDNYYPSETRYIICKVHAFSFIPPDTIKPMLTSSKL